MERRDEVFQFQEQDGDKSGNGLLKKQVEAFQIVLNGERIRKIFSARVYDVAVVLVLGNINADVDHGATLRLCI